MFGYRMYAYLQRVQNVPEDGYTEPLDADGSGVVDYKEVDDFTIEIVTHPQDVQVPEKTTGYVSLKLTQQTVSLTSGRNQATACPGLMSLTTRF